MILFWLALSAFAIGSETFLLSGLLPMLSADLNITAAVAGQLATVFGAYIRNRFACPCGALQ